MLFKTTFLLLTALSTVLQSCKGQIFKDTLQKEVSSKEIFLQSSPQQNTSHHEQISQVVRTVYQDSRGDFWFGTQNGAFKLSNDSLVHIDGIQSESGKGVTIKDITEDRFGKIWFGHTDGISCVSKDTVLNYYEKDGLISYDVWCLEAASSGNIWIGTLNGLCVFNGTTFTPFTLPEGRIDSTLGISSTKMIHSIMEDSRGTIWISTNAGLFSFSNNELVNVSGKLNLPTNFINAIFEDCNGSLWISSNIGLYNLRGDSLNCITTDKIHLEKGIGSVAQDKDGKIWFVANQHYLYTYAKNEIIEYQKTEENKGPVIFQIYNDQEDRLWFVGYGGAFRMQNGKFLNITKDGPW